MVHLQNGIVLSTAVKWGKQAPEAALSDATVLLGSLMVTG